MKKKYYLIKIKKIYNFKMTAKTEENFTSYVNRKKKAATSSNEEGNKLLIKKIHEKVKIIIL